MREGGEREEVVERVQERGRGERERGVERGREEQR